MGLLEGLSVNRRRGFAATLAALALLAALGGASTAHASQASAIVEKCAKGEPFGGYSQSAYRQALKQLPTIVVEYTPCAEQIRKAELAAAGGGGETASSTSPASVPLALTPTEQKAVQTAHHAGAAPVRVGSEPISPGIVHANIASAVNTLPHSLFAVLALMIVAALGLTVGEVRKRVRSRRDG